MGTATSRSVTFSGYSGQLTDGHPALTKRDLLKYFVRTADYLLLHLRDRPLTLNRYPTGLAGKHFFQKHIESELPAYVARECLYAEQHASSGYYAIRNNLPTLLWLGQMANLELHPWYSRTAATDDAQELPQTFSGSVESLEASVLNYPDFMAFDRRVPYQARRCQFRSTGARSTRSIQRSSRY